MVFDSPFADGLSNTMLFTEHYSVCGGGQAFLWHLDALPPIPFYHRTTFADGRPPGMATFGDVYPVTTGFPPVTVASVRGETFQVRPCPGYINCGERPLCNPAVAQTPHSALLTILSDGSFRAISPSISEQTYWAAVTPAGG